MKRLVILLTFFPLISSNEEKRWYREGKLHREDGPSDIYFCKHKIHKFYCVETKQYLTFKEFYDCSHEYYWRDKKVPKKLYDEYLK